ncbi:hypothetical protein DPEC_G00118850, partial [Dallia pectoralis]
LLSLKVQYSLERGRKKGRGKGREKGGKKGTGKEREKGRNRVLVFQSVTHLECDHVAL